jgi:hypothetical protein
MTPTLATLLLSTAALCVSIFALFVARRSSARYHLKRLAVLSAQLAEMDETVATLATALNQERSRARMREVRQNRKATAPDEPAALNGGESPDEWQRRMNRELAAKRLTR